MSPRRIDGWENPRKARELGAKPGVVKKQPSNDNGHTQGPCVQWLAIAAALAPFGARWWS